MEGYFVEYRDRRGRWHRQRGFYDLASDAVNAASAHEVWRVMDAEGNRVAYGDKLLDQ